MILELELMQLQKEATAEYKRGADRTQYDLRYI
jgi:hypothetical protein